MSEDRSCPNHDPVSSEGSRLPYRLASAAVAEPEARPDAEYGTLHFLSGPNRGVLATIGATLGGSMPRVALFDTGPGEDPSPVVRPSSREMPDWSGRLQLFGEIARGGMGAILKGRDPDLGRELAVKVLLDGHRDNPDLVRRFVEEAQIAGQLQHPGVVPVYEMGQFADARPYFSMKMVKGHTLAAVLAERADPADGLSGHLATWLQVCQTVAYAHARGVIHRDLKPSNVMLGSFGEVQVMDWGLAKVLARGGVGDDATASKAEDGETVIATPRSGGLADDLSLFGSILGTPCYMAPEQARGETDMMDERCDVFALGSILCEILTGRPAFTGRTSMEVQRKTARGDTADAVSRLHACGADAELIALARSCLMAREEDRPRDAGVVAARGLAYTAGVEAKRRRAELERVEEQSRRRLTTGGAGAAILFLALGCAGYGWSQQQRAMRVAQTAYVVDEALDEADRLRDEALDAPAGQTGRWSQAISKAKWAEKLLEDGEADPLLRRQVSKLLIELGSQYAAAVERARQFEIDQTLMVNLDDVRRGQAEHANWRLADASYSAAFSKAGFNLDTAAPAEIGRRLATLSAPMEVIGHLDDWAFVRLKAQRPVADLQRLVEVIRAADPDPWRNNLRDLAGPGLAGDGVGASERFRRLADDAAALDAQPSMSLILLARKLKFWPADLDRAARVLRWAIARDPADFRARVELGNLHDRTEDDPARMYPHPEESILQLTAAVAIRPGNVMAHRLLADALEAAGRREEANYERRAVVQIRRDSALSRDRPGVAPTGQRGGPRTLRYGAVR